jgi:ERCC4-related helicase
MKISEIPGIPYKHDLYQATIAAIEIAARHRYVLLILPTNCGKTFVGGIIAYYNMHILKKSVANITPNDDLKA